MSLEPATCVYGIRFQCPACPLMVQPEDFHVSSFNPNLHDMSLKEAYFNREIRPEVIQDLLTKSFRCDGHETPVRLPELDAVFLVAVPQ
jgi:hypothetical protein